MNETTADQWHSKLLPHTNKRRRNRIFTFSLIMRVCICDFVSSLPTQMLIFGLAIIHNRQKISNQVTGLQRIR